ncbi:MAG: hypothetical protein QNJ63_09835 [Calothrix sp. MO_192.B10]|nr:hypothetical protein [Calothrix sp. MO_192.B10]
MGECEQLKILAVNRHVQKQNHPYNLELNQLQELLQGWVHQGDKLTETANLAPIAGTWSERVLDMSGLLVAADSKTA